jgi:hypothetical protein
MPTRRTAAARWLCCVLPALAIAFWRWLWLQWHLPGEDLWGTEYYIAAPFVDGIAIGAWWRTTTGWIKSLMLVALAVPLWFR